MNWNCLHKWLLLTITKLRKCSVHRYQKSLIYLCMSKYNTLTSSATLMTLKSGQVGSMPLTLLSREISTSGGNSWLQLMRVIHSNIRTSIVGWNENILMEDTSRRGVTPQGLKHSIEVLAPVKVSIAEHILIEETSWIYYDTSFCKATCWYKGLHAFKSSKKSCIARMMGRNALKPLLSTLVSQVISTSHPDHCSNKLFLCIESPPVSVVSKDSSTVHPTLLTQ